MVATRLHKEEKLELVEKVGGGQSTRSASHAAWLPDHHLAPNWLIQVDGGPIHPINIVLTVKVKAHTTF
jgi:hypothetical protein